MPELLHGTADARFDKVRTLMRDNIETGRELGASITVDLHGETIADLWGGHGDAQRTIPWSRDTIVNVWSSTKTVTNLAALMLVDRGMLDVFAPVAKYWPEFAANGKDAIEVRHIMSHTSGVSGWEPPFAVDDMYDWERSTQLLASQAPWWEPGTASGYHANSMGHLVGEVVRRVSGKSLKEFVRTEIAEPLRADFQIGARADDDHRIAEIIPPRVRAFDLSTLPPNVPMFRTFHGPVSDPTVANTEPWRRADLGAGNGHGNARALARILSAVSLGGEVDGVKLLSPTTIELIFQEQADGVDLVLGVPLRWGIGYGLPQPATVPSISDDDRACFWGGWGGSMIVMHPDRGLTISYVMNQMAEGVIGSEAANSYLTAIYEALA
ncbi:CubicO group peptidase (beta-lactamase class C family) [Tamaricihabitans halophyticus]|uniref:CubicO group peptidase (Beta-lactamase class C family) n=1 Tax=Tamaricihabitans halophyticus TaxID=1262583 RepID=A0A4R2QT54_9PSEU|nr:serine hydrolase domain-containing protein [Tamaricihabitans halophyticus]TCP51898.1 CubicO group peptidase (beta-lactamase class C family) [Tamaricihabitans halophyticus]